MVLAIGCATDVVRLTLDVPPTVVSTVPPAGAASVALDQTITVNFSEEIDPTSTTGAFTVYFDAAEHAGTVSAANSSLRFTPTEPFAFATEHVAHLAPAIRDLSGRNLVLASAYQWTFTTRDLTFSSAEGVSLSISEPTIPAPCVASRERAVVTWHRYDGIRSDILVSEYTSGNWAQQQVINSAPANAIYPDVVIDGTGVVTAAWSEDIGSGCYAVWSARNSGAGWDLPVRIDNNTCSLGIVYLAANSSGVVIAAWQQTNGTVTSVSANRYVPVSGWEGGVVIEQEATSVQNQMDVEIDDAGNAMVVFQAFDGTRYNVFASRFVPGTGWSTVPLETTMSNAQNAQIAVAPNGYAVIVWEQADAVPDIVFATFMPGVGYSTAALVEGDESGPCSSPSVAISRTGTVVAVWERSIGGQFDSEAAFLPSGATTWQPSLKIESTSEAARFPRVAIDARGFAVSTWRQFDGVRNNAWSARYSPTSGWGPAMLLETDSGESTSIDVSLAEDGYGFVVWSQTAGAEDRVRSSAVR